MKTKNFLLLHLLSLLRIQAMTVVFGVVILGCFFSTCVTGEELDLSFPSYYIQIETASLDLLNKYPFSDVYYPATLFYGTISVECEVRYRGATSRNHPKKSWKIKFPDDNNVFHQERLNFNAHFYDKTLLRDYLANSLYDFIDYPSSRVSFANLFVNNEHVGLYLQTEQIDEYFLKRNGRKENNLYKAVNHACSMTPMTRDSHYPPVYEKKLGNSNDYSDIKLFFSKAKYWSDDDFAAYIENEIDVDSFLKYIAVIFAIQSADNYCKNYYLYSNPESGLFEVFPWDNDAAFGNGWQGDYIEALETVIAGSFLDNHTVFRRLMYTEKWRVIYWNYVKEITADGFPYLLNLIDTVADDVKHDIYAGGIGEPQEFDEALSKLRRFLANRSAFLKDASMVLPSQLTEYYCSNPFPDDENPEVVFTVKSASPQKIYCVYSDDLDFEILGDGYTDNYLRLYDDGEHNDGESGDLVYGNSMTVADGYSGIIPYMFVADGFAFPENGFLTINGFRTHTLALNCMNEPSEPINSLVIGDVFFSDGDYFVEIKNESTVPLDLSYCYLLSDNYFQLTVMPENTVIQPNETLIAASDSTRATAMFDDVTVLGNTMFELKSGCRLALLQPDFSVIAEKTCSQIKPIYSAKSNVIINEINYNSASDFDTGDWLEIYNAETSPVDISGWTLMDSNENHQFVFPVDTIIDTDEYFVIVRDKVAFTGLFPDVETVEDALNFGLSGAGEKLRLYNGDGVLVDSLSYDDKDPWPEMPDSGGSSLSLINPWLDNALPGSWSASKMHGTPGVRNDVYTSKIKDKLSIGGNYPNPFKSSTAITFSLSVGKRVRIDVYNVSGQRVATLLNSLVPQGSHTVLFNGSEYPCGVYIYKVETNTSRRSGKMLLVR